MLHVNGDPLKLRKPFDECRRNCKEEELKIKEMAAHRATSGFVLEPYPKDWGEDKSPPKKVKKVKRKLTREELLKLLEVLS